MRTASALLVTLTLLAASAPAATLKMPPAPAVELAGVTPLPLTAGLYLPAELRSAVEVVKTSPLDKIKYPVGEFTVELFELNLPKVFTRVVASETATPAEGSGVDVVVRVELVKFEATIPHPAYNPYTASAVYRLTVTDRSGETVFTQTANGEGQTSKGMMSGFKAQSLAAESAKLAMVDAATKALEGLLAAEELRGPAQGDAAATPPETPKDAD